MAFGVTRAPEIDRPGIVWFNTPAPLSLAALRGRLVILDFWTFCCINCMHVLPRLRQVEEMFPDEVAVIGVHTPKFTAERDPANVGAAIRRYDIAHPVAHDPAMALWRAYAVRAWPTLVFISPDGYVIGQHAGEPDPDRLVAAVRKALERWRKEGESHPAPLPLAVIPEPASRLRFPGKIKPVPGTRKHWALADSGHHQIVLLDDTGGEIGRYGAGTPDSIDGAAGTAHFRSPQGLVAGADAIYVADTGNHAIRRIELANGTVTTLAGTGQRGGPLGAAAPGRETALASPWDLELLGRRLLFANAGTHQLGEIDLDDSTVRRLAGSGAEAIIDGPAAEAALAQPSGLALSPDGGALYIADSETSSIRRLSLGEAPRIDTLVGTGLFDFGHVNGPLAAARLQHPLGIAWWDGWLVVADSYNAALRSIDLGAGQVGDVDDGFLCTDPVCLPLAEPAGVTADGADRLLVADTNNHRVIEIDLSRRQTRTWAV